jgi:DNA-binding MarR family transcriptional regulator
VLSNTISGRIAELYDREFGLSIQEWRVMTVVADAPGINAKEIGRRTAMDKVAVSRAITSLLTSRRLERRTHDEDRRHSELYLTAAGEAVYRRIVPMALAEEARLLKTLSASEREQLNVLLSKLARAAEPSRDLW